MQQSPHTTGSRTLRHRNPIPVPSRFSTSRKPAGNTILIPPSRPHRIWNITLCVQSAVPVLGSWLTRRLLRTEWSTGHWSTLEMAHLLANGRQHLATTDLAIDLHGSVVKRRHLRLDPRPFVCVRPSRPERKGADVSCSRSLQYPPDRARFCGRLGSVVPKFDCL
jgi:hypothetical protein